MSVQQSRIICESPRLILRTVTPEDFEDVHEMIADQRVMKFVAGTKTKSETQQWLEWILAEYDRDGICFWAIELKTSGEFVGMVGLLAKEVGGYEEIELVYRVKKEFWGKGYATEAAKCCENYAKNNLQLKRLIALVHPENIASRRVAGKVGLSLEKEVEYQGIKCQVFSKNF